MGKLWLTRGFFSGKLRPNRKQTGGSAERVKLFIRGDSVELWDANKFRFFSFWSVEIKISGISTAWTQRKDSEGLFGRMWGDGGDWGTVSDHICCGGSKESSPSPEGCCRLLLLLTLLHLLCQVCQRRTGEVGIFMLIMWERRGIPFTPCRGNERCPAGRSGSVTLIKWLCKSLLFMKMLWILHTIDGSTHLHEN